MCLNSWSLYYGTVIWSYRVGLTTGSRCMGKNGLDGPCSLSDLCSLSTEMRTSCYLLKPVNLVPTLKGCFPWIWININSFPLNCFLPLFDHNDMKNNLYTVLQRTRILDGIVLWSTEPHRFVQSVEKHDRVVLKHFKKSLELWTSQTLVL